MGAYMVAKINTGEFLFYCSCFYHDVCFALQFRI